MPSTENKRRGPTYNARKFAWLVTGECPYCGSKDISSEELQCGGQRCVCKACGAENMFRKGVKVK